MYNLPNSHSLNIPALSELFNSTTNSYKYLYFLSLLDIIKRKNFNRSLLISFREITIEMLANAWYPYKYFNLSFGKQDQISNKLDELELDMAEIILKTDPDKTILRITLNSQNIDDIIDFINRYVPYRLIRPFFQQETRKLKDYDVNPIIINLANNEFNIRKPLYCFDAEEQKDCNSIILHPEWVIYLEENYTIVRDWVSWEWITYMEKRNPNISNIANKLFIS